MSAFWKWLMSLFSKPKPVIVKPVEPNKPTAADSFSGSVLHTCPDSVRLWPVVSGLTVRRANGRLFFTTDKPALWPNIDGCCADIHCGLFRDGRWHYGPCDGLRPFSGAGEAPAKEDSCACVPDGKKRLYVPDQGEEVRFVITGFCRRGRGMKPAQRSSESIIVW